MEFLTNDEYLKLIKIARKFNSNYLDIVHDAILKGKTFEVSIKLLNFGGKKYHTVNLVDKTIGVYENVCKDCNRNLPSSMFRICFNLNSKYLGNQCNDCKKKYVRDRYHSVKEVRQKILDSCKKRLSTQKYKDYQKEYRRQNSEKNKVYQKEYKKKNKLHLTE